MTSGTLHRASDTYGRSLRDQSFHRVLRNLGVGEEPVRVVLADTTIGEFFDAFDDITACPVMVLDFDRQRIGRLDFYRGSGPAGVEVNRATQFGMLVDAVTALHRDVSAELLEACVHAQTREFAFA